MTNSHIDNLVSAITTKISGLISSHNSDSSAHSSKFNSKQDSLVSGTNIKTINNNSLLGSGNLTIESGSGGSNITDYYYDFINDEIVLEYDSGVTQADIVTSWSSTLSDTNVPSEKLVKDSLDAIGSVTVDSALSSTSENPVQNKVIYNALSSKISTSNTVGLMKNDGSVDTSSYITSSSLPSASTSTPSADTSSGSYGSGTSYARSNHTHPKSSLYAESTHTHTYSNITNVSYVTATVTYTDNSTETIKLLKYTGS